jgi:hypothetical protein
MSVPDPRGLEQLLTVATEAFAAGSYGAAYHLLLAVLHFADDAGDQVLLKRLEELAERQAAELDRRHPRHGMATAAAHDRGHKALFTNAAVHARAAIARVAGAAAIERAEMVRGASRPEA